MFRKNVETGEVSFHPLSTVGNKLVAKTYRYVRVRILSRIDSDFMLTGQSSFDYKYKNSSHEIINEIEMARFFLFEEDLFYQISREASILLSYNVSVTDDKVSIETGNEIIEFESVLYDEANEEDLDNHYQNVSSISSINNKKCQLILTYLKLMLCCFYKYNLKLRQKVPTSLTKWKQSNSHPLLLRPLLGNIRHSKYLEEVNEILVNLAQQYNLNHKLELKKYTNLDGKLTNPFKRSIEIPNSLFTWTVQNQAGNVLNVAIIVTSNEVFADFITKLTVTRFDSQKDYLSNMNGVNVLQNDYYDAGDLNESLEWLICDFNS